MVAQTDGQVFFTAQQCADRYQIDLRTWHRFVARGEAPRPMALGRLVRWSLDSLVEFETSRVRTVGGVKCP